MPKLTLTLALPVPEDMTRQLAHLHRPQELAAGPFTGVTWKDPRCYHITLRHLGRISEHRLARVGAALANMAVPQFYLSLASIVTFDDVKHLVATLYPSPDLLTFRQQLDARLKHIPLPVHAHPYNPHITLARFEDIEALRNFIPNARKAPVMRQPFEVSHMVLQGPTVPAARFPA